MTEMSLPFSNLTTSRGAAESIRPDVPRLKRQVRNAIEWGKGLTCAEVEEALQLSHQTVSARIRELALLGEIRDSGDKRKTSSGRRAIVWVIEGDG